MIDLNGIGEFYWVEDLSLRRLEAVEGYYEVRSSVGDLRAALGVRFEVAVVAVVEVLSIHVLVTRVILEHFA